MKIFRWIAVAFSMYSKIPMPKFEWKDEDMSDSLSFFPLVGVVIGAAVVLVNQLPVFDVIPPAVKMLLTVLMPLAITGGFHADGFMDTEDALNSYAPTEKKLEILKDPHIGSFAIISLVKWLLAYTAAVSAVLLNENCELNTLLILGSVFVMSRVLSGLSSLLFKKAKKKGMLYEETKNRKTAVQVCLSIWLILTAAFMIYLAPVHGSIVILSFLLFIVYYRNKMYKEFGGVTGDTAGFCLTVSELIATAALAVTMYFF